MKFGDFCFCFVFSLSLIFCPKAAEHLIHFAGVPGHVGNTDYINMFDHTTKDRPVCLLFPSC